MKKVEVYHHTRNLDLLKNILHDGLKAKESPTVDAKLIYAYLEPIDDFPWVSFLVNPKDAKVGNNALATLYLTSGNKKFKDLYFTSIMALEKYMKRSKLGCEFRNPVTALPITEEELDYIAKKGGNYFLLYDPEVLVERDIIPRKKLVKWNPEL